MLIDEDSLLPVLEHLSRQKFLSLDTETTGLRPHHGDSLFSIAISDEKEDYYFNFKQYPLLLPRHVLGVGAFLLFHTNLFRNPDILWYIHNAPFDLAILANQDLYLQGEVHCTQANARVVYNEHFKYSLEACGERIGYPKDPRVEEYIARHGLFTRVNIPGKKTQRKDKHYDRVPLSIIMEYAQRDGRVCFNLGEKQRKEIDERTNNTPAGVPKLRSVYDNERRLTKTIVRMERVGVKADLDFCKDAAQWESGRCRDSARAFEERSGKSFIDSGKLFAEVFQSDRANWGVTKKGRPSFDSEALRNFRHPAAKDVLNYRDGKAKSNFYLGFLYHADNDAVVHPHFNPGGTATGRFSSSNPNFQNLKKDKGDSLQQKYIVRRAIVPRPGKIFLLFDYDQMEYRLMLDLAARMVGHTTPLISKIQDGLDVHEATAQIAHISRDQAKTTNFLTLYGGGNAKLAANLGCTLSEAKRIRQAIFRGAPEIKFFINKTMGTAERRGWVFNWYGRVCHFPNGGWAYRAPNYVIQGGCADVIKIAMNQIDELLKHYPGAELVLTIHDELVIECFPIQAAILAYEIKKIMENVYPHSYLPLTVGVEHSYKSLADKVKGVPDVV